MEYACDMLQLDMEKCMGRVTIPPVLALMMIFGNPSHEDCQIDFSSQYGVATAYMHQKLQGACCFLS
jgi:hypothetical protein